MTSAKPSDKQPDATQLFVTNFHGVTFDDLPPEVVCITKDQVLDFFGVALGGSGEAGVTEMRDLVLEWGGTPQSTILRFGDKLPTKIPSSDPRRSSLRQVQSRRNSSRLRMS